VDAKLGIRRPGGVHHVPPAKLRLDAVSPEVLRSAQEQGFLVARVILTDPNGNPTCASVGTPFIEWSAATN